jgi:hypothetical protein
MKRLLTDIGGRKRMEDDVSRSELPRGRVLDFLDALAQEHDLDGMARRVTRELPRLIPCDQTFACFLDSISPDGVGKVSVLGNGISRAACRSYSDFYYQIDPGRREAPPGTHWYQVDWHEGRFARDRFTDEFIKGQLRARLSAGIPLYRSEERV